jgi:hypothetical protein
MIFYSQYFCYTRSKDGVFVTVIGMVCRTEKAWCDSQKGKELFCSPKCQYQLSIEWDWGGGSFPMGKVAGGIMLTTSVEVQNTCSCTYISTYLLMVKVKFTWEQATKAQRGSRCIVLLFLQPWHWMGVGGQCHALTALPPVKTRYPLYRWLGGPQDWSGWVRKISPSSPGFDPQNIQLIVGCCADWAIPAPYPYMVWWLIKYGGNFTFTIAILCCEF